MCWVNHKLRRSEPTLKRALVNIKSHGQSLHITLHPEFWEKSFLPSSFILSPQLLGGTVVLQLEVNLTNVQWIRVKREGSLQLKTGIASWEQIIHLTSTRTLTLRSSACSRGTNCCEQRTLQSRLVGESSLNSCGEWLVYVLKWWYKTPSFRVSAILHQDCCSHLTQGADLP